MVEDVEILDALQELGYSRDTIFLLFLVPVIHVGWIDGQVTEQEREAILEIARQREVSVKHEPYHLVPRIVLSNGDHILLMICFTGVLRSSWYICSMPSEEIHLPNNCGA